jgi:DNA-binding NarL/FixJ family response regulator
MSVHYLDTSLAPAIGKAPQRSVHLSPRQAEVLMLLGEGLANKPIGRRLGISACTVKQHVQAILKEFGAANRLQAVIFAYRYGILANELEIAAAASIMALPLLPPLVSGV